MSAVPISKPSGIKPPTSRIAKPATGRPSISNGSSESSDRRRGSEAVPPVSGKLSEHDGEGSSEVVVEGDAVGELPSLPGSRKTSEQRRMSDGSAIDPAYEIARRLSEAGVRRMSDAGVILTADTDSFIIGERVYVNGVKPGSIQFIGETKFAPGDWAGIVLDDFTGKNDGSVGGVRYFQCQPKRGIFSRLTKLTRQPLDAATIAAMAAAQATGEASQSLGETSSSKERSPSPSAASYKSSSPAPATPTTAATSLQSIGELRLGDRVIVTSSQGSKTGILRYLGTTEFANGQWAGVELDDPVGKNDGSVGDKRYFECQAKYGLFAPISKVTRSPANSMRRTSGMMNSSMISNRSGLVRQGTRDSLGSASVISAASRASTAVSRKTSRPSAGSGPSQNALEDLLREKEKHIEQLLKEREMERCEVTRAAAQADEAEQQAALLKRQLQEQEAETEAKYQRLEELYRAAEAARATLAAQVDDLQFRIEEQNIMNSEFEAKEKELASRKEELERQLEEEKHRVEQLEVEAQRCFEAEELVARYKDELDSLNNDYQATKEKLENLEENAASVALNETEQLAHLQSRIQHLQQSLESIRSETSEKDGKITDLESKLQSSQSKSADLEQLQGKVQEELKVLAEQLELFKTEKASVQEALKQETDQRKDLEEKLQARLSDFAKAESDWQERLTKSQSSIESLLAEKAKLEEDLSNFANSSNDTTQLIAKLQAELREKDKEIESKNEEVTKLETTISSMKKEQEETIQKVARLNEEVAEYQKEKQISQALREKLEVLEKEASQAKSKVDETSQLLSQSQKDLKESESRYKELEKSVADLQQQLESSQTRYSLLSADKDKLEADLAEFASSSSDATQMVGKLRTEICDKEKELMAANETIAKFQANVAALEKEKAEIDDRVAQLNKEIEMHVKEQEISRELKLKLEALKQEKLSLTTQLGEATTSLSTAHETTRVLEERCRDLEQTSLRLQQELESSKTSNSALVAYKEKLEANLAEITLSSAAAAQTNAKLQADIDEKERELTARNETVSKLQASIAALEQDKSEADKQVKNLQDQIQVHLKNEEISGGLQSRLDSLEKEKLETKQQFDETSEILAKTREELEQTKKLATQFQVSLDSIQNELRSVQNENSEAQEVIEELKNREIQLQSERADLEKQVSELKARSANAETEKKSAEEQLARYSAERTSWEREREAFSSTINDRESRLRALTEEVEKLRVQFDAHRTELQAKLAETKREAEAVGELQAALEKARFRADELQILLEESETERAKNVDESRRIEEDLRREVQRLKESIDLKAKEQEALLLEANQQVKSVQEELGQFRIKLGETQLELQEERDERDRFQNEVFSLKKLTSARDAEIKLLQQNISDLEKSNAELRQLQSTLASVELEKRQLEEKMVRLQVAAESKNQAHSSQFDTDSRVKQLKEENESASREISFLNSVIVDMQKKVDDLKMQLEISRATLLGQNITDINLNGIKSEVVAPRLFCDICDVFDLHDTEDCPKQSSDFVDTADEEHSHHSGKRGEARAYCENCEVFGHWTDNCEEETTY